MKPYHRNPRQITERQFGDLRRWLAELGDLGGIVHDLNSDEIIGGNQRARVFDVNQCEVVLTEEPHEPDEQGTVALGYVVWQGKRYGYRQVRWTERQCQQANVVANKAGGGWDWDVLADQFEVDDLLDWGFTELALGLDTKALAELSAEDAPLVARVPDAVWPTDNDWGVPLLDVNLQARALEAPFTRWGAVARTSRMRGTWHFYTEDYRFEALWHDPAPVVESRCTTVIEPNFSCYNEMPMAVGLWQIYRKRWLARWWQSYGIQVLVDMNVAAKFYDLNWLGVPEGWAAYGTRGYTDRLDGTEHEYEMACEHAGTTSILFVVYGGGKAVEEACKERGWLWFCETMHHQRRGLPMEGEEAADG